MNIKEIRRQNMNILAARHGGYEGLGKKVGTAPNYLSQINSGTRNVGHKLARDIERALGLPEGWMDQPHEVLGVPATTSPTAPPLLSYEQLKQWHESKEIPEGVERYSGPFASVLGPQQVAVKIRDDSMGKEVRKGTYVAAELRDKLDVYEHCDTYGFFVHEGHVLFGRYEKIGAIGKFVFANKVFDPIPEKDVEIIAQKMFWWGD